MIHLNRRASRLLLPLYEAVSGRRPGAVLGRLRQLQWCSAEEIEAHALGKLRPLLEHSAANVPHYRDLLAKAGLAAAEVERLSDLERVPVTSKLDLRAGFPERVVAMNLPQSRRWRTWLIGSTGKPSGSSAWCS